MRLIDADALEKDLYPREQAAAFGVSVNYAKYWTDSQQ